MLEILVIWFGIGLFAWTVHCEMGLLKKEIINLKKVLWGSYGILTENDLKERVYLINRTLKKMKEKGGQ